jgi:hypothetical protein
MNRLNFKEIDQPLQARLLASSPSVGIQARSWKSQSLRLPTSKVHDFGDGRCHINT